MTVIDAHQHFWDTERDTHEWLSDLPAINRPFGPDDLRPHLERNGVDATVLVEVASSESETLRFCEIAERTDFVAGVVGWVDLRTPDVADRLAALAGAPDGRWLRGIRHQVQSEADDWLAAPEVHRGLRAVGDAGLAYDVLVLPRHLEAALKAVRACPDTRFVIDHVAKPPIASGELEPWASLMRGFGGLPNVWCKLSGMVTEADHERWTPSDLKPYVDGVLEWFGTERVLFGSDWPVCLLAATYDRVVEALDEVLGPLDDTTRRRIYCGNAIDVYRLEVAA